jgi:hypothetical protein
MSVMVGTSLFSSALELLPGVEFPGAMATALVILSVSIWQGVLGRRPAMAES